VYGVTMQEPGVSSVVSVRLRGKVIDDEPGVADAAAAEPAEDTVEATIADTETA